MTETLQSRLAPGAGSGIYRLGGRASASAAAADAVGALAAAARWHFLHFDASEVEDKPAFLAAGARALDFPEWAGHNWDAFEELVNDLSRLPPAPGYLLLIDGLGHFAKRHPGELRTGLAILETAAANRRGTGEPPLVILLRGAGTPARHFPPLTLEQPQRPEA